MKTNTIPSQEFSALFSRLGISQGQHPTPAEGEWNLETLSGRIAELSSNGLSACFSAAVSIIIHAQQRGEPAAWVAVGESTFFPPDVAQSGVDLDALPVIRTNDTRAAALHGRLRPPRAGFIMSRVSMMAKIIRIEMPPT